MYSQSLRSPSAAAALLAAVLCFVWLLGLESAVVHAATPTPKVSVMVQPDGTRFGALQSGDGWRTVLGQPIVFNGGNKTWYYAVPGEYGGLVPGIKAVGTVPLVSAAPDTRPQAAAAASRTIQGRVYPAAVKPAFGIHNILTILVNFSDRKVTYGRPAFETMLFGKNNHSMVDYYNEVSYGQFGVSPGPAGVRGWYTAPYKHDDVKVGDLVVAAIKAADEEGVNFAPYDQDGDCLLDTVNIVHQGSSTDDFYDLMTMGWTLERAYNDGWSTFPTYVTRTPCAKGGFIRANDFFITPERLDTDMSTVGASTHEYGHKLGLIDLYDPDYDSLGADMWSLMASGDHRNIHLEGDLPSHLDPWSKMKLGWVKPTKITSAIPSTYTIYPAESRPSVYQFGDGDPTTATGEYYLVENRQMLGFDSALWGSGLLIWHIDESKDFNNDQCYPGGPSCVDHHYRVSVVQADGVWALERNWFPQYDATPFPGKTGKTSFNDDTNPSARYFSGERSGIRISSIAVSGLNITATMALGALVPRVDMSYSSSGTGKGTVTFSPAGSFASCPGSCINSFPAGTVVTMSAAPAPGSVFAGWSGACSGTGSCTVTTAPDQMVVAIFTSIPASSAVLSYTASGTGSGTVSFGPAGSLASCSRSCANSFAVGNHVTLRATPASGSVFNGWSGAGCSGTGSCNIRMSEARSVTAKFSVLPLYPLSYFKLGTGTGTVGFAWDGNTASCASSCTKSYVVGTKVTLKAVPGAGSAFAGWSGPVCSGKVDTCTLAISLAQYVTASFAPLRASANLQPAGLAGGRSIQ